MFNVLSSSEPNQFDLKLYIHLYLFIGFSLNYFLLTEKILQIQLTCNARKLDTDNCNQNAAFLTLLSYCNETSLIIYQWYFIIRVQRVKNPLISQEFALLF